MSEFLKIDNIAKCRCDLKRIHLKILSFLGMRSANT
jgi:hypothetical protein